MNLSGPFQTDADNPASDPASSTGTSRSRARARRRSRLPDIEAGVTVTEDNLYVNYNGTDYELGEEAYTQLPEQQEAAAPEDTEGLGFTEQCEQAIEAQGGDAAACDFDVTAWFSELENEGTEDVGGAEATHIAGTLDVEQMVTDLFTLGSSVPGATGGVDPSLIEPQLASSPTPSPARTSTSMRRPMTGRSAAWTSRSRSTRRLSVAPRPVSTRLRSASRSRSPTSARSRRSRLPLTRSRSRTSPASSAASA